MVELIQTKLVPPMEPRRLIERPRLEVMLAKVVEAKLTLIQTPAGYGKTSLLWQWYQKLQATERSVAWLSIDKSDTDPALFLTYVVAALSCSYNEFDEMVAHFLQDTPYLAPDFILHSLTNKLAQIGRPVFIFLDDIHLIGASNLQVLQRMIEISPTTVHIIAASRVIPDLSLAKMRAREELLELGVDELMFTQDEVELFFHDTGHGLLQEDEVQAFESRTEGWIAGLKLANLAWQRRGVSAREFLSSFAGSRRSIADYFAAEVLAEQSPELQTFLISTSVLDQLTPDLCDAVTQAGNGRQMLDQIEDTGLFLLRLDEDRVWYRYHHLFSQFLFRYLSDRDTDAERILCARASDWFSANDFHVQAVEYALRAGDPERAAQILESKCQDMAYSGHIRLVAQYSRQIPMSVLQRYPAVLLTWAWLLTYSLRFEESQELLDVARTRLEEIEKQDSPEMMRRLNGLLVHQEMSLAAARDNVFEVEQLCKQLLDGYQDAIHPYLLATAYSLLVYAQREQYKLGDLDAQAAKAKGLSKRCGYPLSQVVYYANVGPSLFFLGKLDEAQHTLEEGLTEANHFGAMAALPALVALPLSSLLYERNQVDAAQKLLTDISLSETTLGFVDQLTSGYLTQARLHILHGDLPAAYEILDAGMTVAMDRDLERLRMALVAERIRFLLQYNTDLEQAIQYARAAGIATSPETVLPGEWVTTVVESKAVAWVRIAQKQDRLSEARDVVKQWRRFSAARGALVSEVRWDILLAQLQLLGGEQKTAQRTLRKALGLATPMRMFRSFLDEGAIIQTLLGQSVDRTHDTLHPIDLFAAELLDQFSPGERQEGSIVIEHPPVEGLYGKLTARELEILALVGKGLRNVEIANNLGMTEGSIKWYLQQIYDKLGTRRRLQAVERARQLGLLV